MLSQEQLDDAKTSGIEYADEQAMLFASLPVTTWPARLDIPGDVLSGITAEVGGLATSDGRALIAVYRSAAQNRWQALRTT